MKDKRPDNAPRLIAKLRKDIEYIKKAFPEYKQVFMFWSPVVKNQRSGAKYNQIDDVRRIVKSIQIDFGVAIQPMTNEKFKEALDSLRKMALKETKELASSVTRLLQVEEHLTKHLRRLQPTGGAKL